MNFAGIRRRQAEQRSVKLFQVTAGASKAAGSFRVSSARWRADDRVFVTTIWRDVTERMAAEDALRESKAITARCWRHCRNWFGPAAGGECDYFNPQWQAYTGAPARNSGWVARGHPSSGSEEFEAVEALAGYWRRIRCRCPPSSWKRLVPLVQDAIDTGADG